MSGALIQISGVWREYPAGDQTIAALRDVSLTIRAGEMVAIIGQSGSGKSTLMNILGCLDRPTRGSYEIAGRDTSLLTPDELAALRREYFGFIFQRYHLLGDLDARSNVEIPAIYAGWSRSRRRDRATALLARLGLDERIHHRPNQLSGGQQQRVSVARALMNGGDIILADEPTGALDTKSSAEMLQILQELNAEGHTVIIVTHDAKVAAVARRVIEISDGEIVSDTRTGGPEPQAKPLPALHAGAKDGLGPVIDRLGDAFRMALIAMNAHRLRTFLTMLGIIIGIASVVSIMAVGAGAKQSILGQISAIGTNTLDIAPGTGPGDEHAARAKGYNDLDLETLKSLSYVDGVTPSLQSPQTIRYRGISGTGSVQGVSEQYFRVRNVKLDHGSFFDAASVRAAAQEVVIDDVSVKKLFPGGDDPIGKIILLGSVPARVIGVTQPIDSPFGAGTNLQVWAPYTMVSERMSRQAEFRSLTIKLADGVPASVAQEGIMRALAAQRGKTDFYIRSSESIRQTISQVTGILSLVMGAIGGISLVVGGIGVMNIMLVSVSERTREIGVRSAIGARRSDIMSQFIIEAVLVCLIGGALGLGLSLCIGALIGAFVKNFTLIYSTGSIVMAFATATLIGLIFGWLPARNASRLDPIEALARD